MERPVQTSYVLLFSSPFPLLTNKKYRRVWTPTCALSRAVLLVQFVKHLPISPHPHLPFTRKWLVLVLALYETAAFDLMWPQSPHVIVWVKRPRGKCVYSREQGR